jgi:protein required for attachment to host cells
VAPAPGLWKNAAVAEVLDWEATMSGIWVLVADSSEARIFSSPGLQGPLELVETLRHAPSRAHPRDLGSDVPGRVHDRMGQARHSLDPAQQIKAEERHRFARELAEVLAAGQRTRRFESLVIMAPPAFLGVLRECLGKPVAAAVIRELPKDLVGHDAGDIVAHLA